MHITTQLIFEGEFKNGKINGKVKEYDYDTGELKYEGEYLNDLKNGKGKEYIYGTDKLLFEGEYYLDRRFKGKLYIKGKIEYEGQFLYERKWEGKGYDAFGNIIYELHNGTGKVKEYNNIGRSIFKGEYLYGKRIK